MASLCLSPATNLFAFHHRTNKKLSCHQCKLSSAVTRRVSSSLSFNPLRVSIKGNDMMMVKNRGGGVGAVCYAGPISTRNLQWISTISSVVLMLAKGTAIHKSFLAPLLALQAPSSVISWIKGDFGVWTAFVALIVRLFCFIPGELELPFMAMLLVIVAPYQVLNLRGTQEGAIISLVMTGYLTFQHFSRIGNLQKAFDQGSIVATLAIICIAIVSCLFLI